MAPRKTRAAQQAAEEAAEVEAEQARLQAEDTTLGNGAPAGDVHADADGASRPAKKARRDSSGGDHLESIAPSHRVENAVPPPPPPQSDYQQPPPPADEQAALPPPPPSTPPIPDDDLPPSPSPPPPPPPADEDIQDAEYWARMAEEEETKHKEESKDLYLDTINRSLLDFDFEKLCSVTLSNINIYACLVCGKYFQGRGKSSNAYFHSINQGHRVYMNLEDARVYILPDNYEVDSPSLSDIKYLLHPTYTPQQIRKLDAPDASPSLDLQGRPYWPGYVGLNNVGENDYINVILQSLAHVTPLRDYFLTGSLKQQGDVKSSSSSSSPPSPSPSSLAHSSELVRRFASLIRKLWNPRAFKAQVSPHEFLQEVNTVSKGRFKLMSKGDPVEFLGWLLNQLHLDLTGGSRRKPSIISLCFQGQVRVESQQVIVRTGLEDLDNIQPDALDHDGRKESGQEDDLGNVQFNFSKDVQSTQSPFFLLAIDLPTPPIFQDVVAKNIIPQVSIAQVLAKYDGVSFQEARGTIRRYKCAKLPPYLILHFRRFTKNNFVEERNPTIVNFPIKALNLADVVDNNKDEAPISTMYDLVSNTTHECTPGTVRDDSVWRSQVHRDVIDQKADGAQNSASEDRWFQIQDLIVEDINRQMIFLGETYVQIWKRRGGADDQVKRGLATAANASASGAQSRKRK